MRAMTERRYRYRVRARDFCVYVFCAVSGTTGAFRDEGEQSLGFSL